MKETDHTETNVMEPAQTTAPASSDFKTHPPQDESLKHISNSVPSTLRSSQGKVSSPSPLFALNSQRLWICLLLMLGFYVVVSMRLNLGMALVCMVNSTAFPSTARSDLSSQPIEIDNHSRCSMKTENMTDQGYNGSLMWSPQMQSILFSALFYGSLVTITVSGTIADKFGPKSILGGSVFVYIIMTLAAPGLSQHSYYAYFISRIIMGLAEGFVNPCLGSMSGRWFPPNERSTMAAIYTSGNQLASSLSSVISASLCSSPMGWPAIFYLFGALGIVWLVGWCIFATDSPDDNAFISERESLYLRETIKRKKKVGAVPWRAMLHSKAVYACLGGQFAFNFSNTITQGFLPTYFRDELLLSLDQNGIYTSIPFLSQLVMKIVVSLAADKLKQKKILTQTQCSIISQTICGIFSFAIPGFFTSFLSIAPQHSGTMTSLTMTAGSIANILGPLWLSLVMLMKTRFTWPLVFFACALVNIVTGAIFYLYGSSDVQDWAKEGESSAQKSSSNAVHPAENATKESELEDIPL